ncbi:hypothetical protein PYW07_005876 [Mythimna separata]|uniref:Uncharacterized protein n=1 Tax=Mythimna separata TaxID=271217 RepID=A0AAD8DRQ1_MYTSE|nr:hypothetical protein PYW07_005876 [Mythimna separata]
MTLFGEQQASVEIDTSSIWSGLFKGLQSMLHNVDPQISNFKAVLASVPENERNHFNFVIRADKRPITAHPGWYNAPTTNEFTNKAELTCVILALAGEEFLGRVQHSPVPITDSGLRRRLRALDK